MAESDGAREAVDELVEEEEKGHMVEAIEVV